MNEQIFGSESTQAFGSPRPSNSVMAYVRAGRLGITQNWCTMVDGATVLDQKPSQPLSQASFADTNLSAYAISEGR